ncbi:MAG TPA: hypothetical protein VEF03_09450 [Candidatus Binataceae bacterium]|nr:hypothetical protein [Candidatus Binataceae bacterium]
MNPVGAPENFLTIDGQPLEEDFFPKPRRRKTVTSKTLAANRANARLSTGPRTAEGKERSRLNAIRHGVLSEVAVSADLEGDEAREEFDRLLEEMIRDLKPLGAMEELTLQKIAVYTWRLRRMLIWENREAFREYISRKVRSERISHGLYDIEDGIPSSVQKERQHEREVIVNAQLEVMSLPNSYTSLAVTRYDSTINRVIDRAMRDLERMQARRREYEGEHREEPSDPSLPGRSIEEGASATAAGSDDERPAEAASSNDPRKSSKKTKPTQMSSQQGPPGPGKDGETSPAGARSPSPPA